MRMVSFLDDTAGSGTHSYILSAHTAAEREGADFKKGLNFRDGANRHSVIVISHGSGEERESWDPARRILSFRGHDDTSSSSAHSEDTGQVLEYEKGTLSDNGKFYRAAIDTASGARTEPLLVQVYERIEEGVFFDKGFFTLIGAREESGSGRREYYFDLQPCGEPDSDYDAERFLSLSDKREAWGVSGGACERCGSDVGLHFLRDDTLPSRVMVLCTRHSGRNVSLL